MKLDGLSFSILNCSTPLCLLIGIKLTGHSFLEQTKREINFATIRSLFISVLSAGPADVRAGG